MFGSNSKPLNSDVATLVKDAQALLQSAKSLTGEKADEARNQGMLLLDTVFLMAHDMQESAVGAGKAMVSSAGDCVKDNPWRSVALAAGTGLLVGVILGRK
ncbi:YqjD family protein [Iodobacter arcticus]|uniref:YqjD family protein n=1 Tax=Iodobacter arcticus TaxID=590593 RepID=A0ABW2QSV7_9NEIS